MPLPADPVERVGRNRFRRHAVADSSYRAGAGHGGGPDTLRARRCAPNSVQATVRARLYIWVYGRIVAGNVANVVVAGGLYDALGCAVPFRVPDWV